MRELERIAQQIHEHLAYTARIANDIRRCVGSKPKDQLDALLEGGRRKQFRDVLAYLAEVEGTRFQIQFAGFNF